MNKPWRGIDFKVSERSLESNENKLNHDLQDGSCYSWEHFQNQCSGLANFVFNTRCSSLYSFCKKREWFLKLSICAIRRWRKALHIKYLWQLFLTNWWILFACGFSFIFYRDILLQIVFSPMVFSLFK